MDNLWVKESSDASALCMPIFSEIASSTNLKRVSEKSNEIANSHRATGIEMCKSNNLPSAIEEYTKSLCFAELGTASMGLAYANRARCYISTGKYKECLIDIELALNSNCPQKLLPILDQLKAICLEQQSQRQFVKQPLELSYPPIPSIPVMADVLDIQQNAEFGRHVVAKCDIPAGKTILIEPSFVEITTTATMSHCTVCQIVESNLMPCAYCTTAMFCSAECLELGGVFW